MQQGIGAGNVVVIPLKKRRVVKNVAMPLKESDTPLSYRTRLKLAKDGTIYTMELRSNLGHCHRMIAGGATTEEQQKLMDELSYTTMRICGGELLSMEILSEVSTASFG